MSLRVRKVCTKRKLLNTKLKTCTVAAPLQLPTPWPLPEGSGSNRQYNNQGLAEFKLSLGVSVGQPQTLRRRHSYGEADWLVQLGHQALLMPHQWV